ncbi:nucleotidyl transferase AbiEii/AbiGii toxin family protein [Hydrogenimonas sp. SS33]|uniref:nucleotidyl transferase AbiEii/AbiGii toxin family protein n=1 Tax=Hydrogenimonas leucolamina TaxID=2954236 RepID=UPI00336BDC11
MRYDFSEQSELFHIALAILEDYTIESWSFGGGTALSSLYYRHRMSYDIDIFVEEYGEIQRLLAFQEEIAGNLAIDSSHIQASPTGVTFILEDESHGLKLDFVYSPALTEDPFVVKEVFGVSDVKAQTPQEIIAKKLKFREKATIRDFVDYAIAEERDRVLSRLKSQGIVDIDRYFDVINKFDSLAKHIFDEELRWLMPKVKRSKDDFARTIHGVMQPGETITVAVDHTGEVVAFDEFIEPYRALYAELGDFKIYTIPNTGLEYRDLLEMDESQIDALASLEKASEKSYGLNI